MSGKIVFISKLSTALGVEFQVFVDRVDSDYIIHSHFLSLNFQYFQSFTLGSDSTELRFFFCPFPGPTTSFQLSHLKIVFPRKESVHGFRDGYKRLRTGYKKKKKSSLESKC